MTLHFGINVLTHKIINKCTKIKYVDIDTEPI